MSILFLAIQLSFRKTDGASFDRYLSDRNVIGQNRSQRGLTRDKRLLDSRLRFALPRVNRLSEGPAAEGAHRVGRNDLLILVPDAEVVQQLMRLCGGRDALFHTKVSIHTIVQ